MFQSHRSHDAVITVCQDNSRQAIEVRDLNRHAEEVLGYQANSISGRPLVSLLPGRIQTLLNEYVEFEADGNDVGNVLSKVQSFCILDHKGKEVGFKLKVLRSESLDQHAYFRLILQDRAGGRRDEAFRAILRDNFKGHEVLDMHTGLPDRSSIQRDLDLVHHYVNKEALKSCFAVVEVDHYEGLKAEHGEGIVYSLLKHYAAIARQSLRADDLIGTMDEHRLGIILMDTNAESARMVLNRLRWLMAAAPLTQEGKDPLPGTVSISFAPVKGDIGDKDLFTRTEAALGGKTGNALIEVQ